MSKSEKRIREMQRQANGANVEESERLSILASLEIARQLARLADLQEFELGFDEEKEEPEPHQCGRCGSTMTKAEWESGRCGSCGRVPLELEGQEP